MLTETIPQSFNLAVRGRAGTARAVAEVHSYRWADPQRHVYLDQWHCIDMVLSRRPPGARGRFLGEAALGGNAIGELIFLPAGDAMESEWAAGEQQSICCNIDPALCSDDTTARAGPAAGSLDIRNAFVSAALSRLAREALAPGFASGLMVESLCQAVLIDLQQALPAPRPAPSLSPRDLRRIDEMLAVEGPGPGVIELAQAFGLSGRHFARLFRDTTGRSVGVHAAAFRIARAKALLAAPRPMIKEIAWRSGFESAAAFSAAFRHATGLTPRQFRSAMMG